MRTSVKRNMRKRTLEASKLVQSKVKKKKKDRVSSSKKSSARKKKNKLSRRAKNAKKAVKYKEVHAVGRRSSSQFVTYSQDGRLFYDLYTRYTPYASHGKTVNSGTPSKNTHATATATTTTTTTNTTTPNVINRSSKRRLPILAADSKHKPRAAVVRSQSNRHTMILNNKKSSLTKVGKPVTHGRSVESKRTKHVLEKRSTRTLNSKKETAKVRLERKLKRELGADFLPHMQAVSKRLASINAVAIINAVTKDTAKRVPSGGKIRRRDSVDTVPCVEEKSEQFHDIASVHSEDAVTEPMSLSPQREAAVKKSTISPPITTHSVPISFSSEKPTTSETLKKRKKRPSAAVQRKSRSLTKTPVSTTPSQELVSIQPETSTVESYHSEQVIPFGPSSYGFHQITTQVIRYAQPDCPMLLNANAVPLFTGPAGSLGLTPSSTAICPPRNSCPSLNSSEFFNANRAHTFLANFSLPVLTPMPHMSNWPTIIHPYNQHVTQSVPQQISHPSPTIFFPSFIPLQTQVQYPVLPHMLHSQLEHSPTFMPPPSLFPSPMCNFTPSQPSMTPSASLLRPVQPSVSYPSFYYPLTTPTYTVRDGSVPLSFPHPSMTMCTSSPLAVQLPMYSQSIFPFPPPCTIPMSIPVIQQNSQPIAFTSNPLTPSLLGTSGGTSDSTPQQDVSKLPATSVVLADSEETAPELSGPFPSVDTPVRTAVHSNESNSAIMNNTVPCGISINAIQSATVVSLPVATTIEATSMDSEAHSNHKVESRNMCSMDALNNAWQWEGSSFTKAVFCRSDTPPVIRTCYPAIRHSRDGMVIREKDCVLLCSGPDRSTAPHVAKITALFADPNTSDTKMMALLWYYRPEHVGCATEDLVPNELYASRHCDTNPVDCIEDKAYVLTASAFARFMAQAKHRQSAFPRTPLNRVVPVCPPKSTSLEADGVTNGDLCSEESNDYISWTGRVPDNANPSNVFLCRGVYDYRLKRVCRNLNFHMFPIHSHFLINRHRNSRPSSVHSLIEDDANDEGNRSTISPTPVTQTLAFSDSTDAVAQDRSTPSKSFDRLDSIQSASPEPSPADSPSLCICLSDSPDPVVSAPAKALTPVSTTPSVVFSQPGSPPPVAECSHAVERSSTPLKPRDPLSTNETTICTGGTSLTSLAVSSPVVSLPTEALSQFRRSDGGWRKSISAESHCNTTSVLVAPLPASPHLIPTSSTALQTWIPAHSMMPLFESSVLETSADLSVNWAEHGEQIALSLDCRACRPSAPPLVSGVLPSYPILSTGRTISGTHNTLDPTHGETSTMVWSSSHENPVPAELFEPPQMSILCPTGAPVVNPSSVSNPHESDAPRLVML